MFSYIAANSRKPIQAAAGRSLFDSDSSDDDLFSSKTSKPSATAAAHKRKPQTVAPTSRKQGNHLLLHVIYRWSGLVDKDQAVFEAHDDYYSCYPA